MLQQDGHAWKSAARRNSGNIKLMIESRTGDSSKQEGETEMKKVRIQDLKWLLLIQCQKSIYHISMRPLFTHFNAFLQRCGPQAHNVYPIAKRIT